MTKKGLIHAQRLLSIYEGSTAILDTEPGTEELARSCQQIMSYATHAFVCLTGKIPSEVSRVDLNTESPAAWTKEVK
ncbi:MAG: hypothetical protein HY290_14210 [Planctomycetia bacterium]|nr:hypothetical protein [Planctomycetia bacterium]